MPRRSSPERRKRAHGEDSRQRILDAAAQIAGERGYDGTSIALVSERSVNATAAKGKASAQRVFRLS